MRLMRVSVPPVAVAVTALLLAVPSVGQVVPEDFALRAAGVYLANPASETLAPPAHINSAQVGWENVWFSGRGAASGGPSLGSTTRWNAFAARPPERVLGQTVPKRGGSSPFDVGSAGRVLLPDIRLEAGRPRGQIHVILHWDQEVLNLSPPNR